MQKAYNRTYWENYPSDKTAVNKDNLNKMEAGLDEIDDRVVILDTTKATKVEVSPLFSDVAFDEGTGVITFTRKNGAVVSIDTKLEKLAVNFAYDPVTEHLIITLDDGTKQYVDLSALITQYEFIDSDTIGFQVQEDGRVEAVVLAGSITEDKLQPNFLADVKVEAAKAQLSATSASSSASAAANYAAEAESFAHGGTGTRENEDVDNAKYYYEQAKHISQGGNGLVPMGTITFEQLPVSDITANAMYNISNAFISDERFQDGGGISYGPGNNAYYTVDGLWDVLAASGVTGVKGDAETSYRQGNVNITKANVGLGNVPNVTTNNQTPTYTEAATLAELTSGEKLSVAFGKIKLAVKNVINIFMMLGTTDISAMGDGTVTGALSELSTGIANVNSNLGSEIVKTGLIEYIYLDQTLGATSNSAPWLELKAQYNSFVNHKLYIGRINSGAQCVFIGMRTSDAYGTFLVQMYKFLYHVYIHGGQWYYETLTNDWIPF